MENQEPQTPVKDETEKKSGTPDGGTPVLEQISTSAENATSGITASTDTPVAQAAEPTMTPSPEVPSTSTIPLVAEEPSTISSGSQDGTAAIAAPTEAPAPSPHLQKIYEAEAAIGALVLALETDHESALKDLGAEVAALRSVAYNELQALKAKV